MELPEQLWGYAENVLAEQLGAAEQENLAATKKNLWAVVYGLIPFKDGDQWCVLLGENIQVGVCGFGDTPAAAIYEFDKAMGF